MYRGTQDRDRSTTGRSASSSCSSTCSPAEAAHGDNRTAVVADCGERARRLLSCSKADATRMQRAPGVSGSENSTVPWASKIWVVRAPSSGHDMSEQQVAPPTRAPHHLGPKVGDARGGHLTGSLDGRGLVEQGTGRVSPRRARRAARRAAARSRILRPNFPSRAFSSVASAPARHVLGRLRRLATVSHARLTGQSQAPVARSMPCTVALDKVSEGATP